MRVRALGSQTSTGVFVNSIADSTGGVSPYPGYWNNRNTAGNRFTFQHLGVCGYGLIMAGISSGFSGGPQVHTDNTYHDTVIANAQFRGIKMNEWCDTNTFTGNTYIGVVAANGAGIVVNEGHTNNYTVYNIYFEHLAVDTFGSVGGRYGVVLFESKMMFCDQFFQDPQAELGAFVATSCLSYNWIACNPGTNNIIIHQKGVSTGP